MIDNLRDLRLKVGLTQAELARRSGVYPLTISNIETGKYKPRPLTVSRLLKVFYGDREKGQTFREVPSIFLGEIMGRDEFFRRLKPKMCVKLACFFDGPFITMLIDNAEFFSRDRYYPGDFSTAVQLLGDLMHGQRKAFLPGLGDDGEETDDRPRRRKRTAKL